jgi:hypothetical protein
LSTIRLAESFGTDREHVLAVDHDLAGRRVVEPVDHPDQRRLPRARQAHDDEDLAGRDVERDVLDRGYAAGLLEQLGSWEIRFR